MKLVASNHIHLAAVGERVGAEGSPVLEISRGEDAEDLLTAPVTVN